MTLLFRENTVSYITKKATVLDMSIHILSYSLEEGKSPGRGTILYDSKADALHWSSRYALMGDVAWDTEHLITTGEISPFEATMSVL